VQKFYVICIMLAGSLGVTTTLRAQVTLSEQLRTRTEFRDGQHKNQNNNPRLQLRVQHQDPKGL
jgi:hypothetical protein